MGLTRIRAQQISDIDYKQAVRVITLSNITLSGGAPSVVDGVSLITGDRVLVNGQSNAAQNGLYQVQTVGAGSNGTWIRTSDGNEDGEIQPGMVVMVTQGTEYADTPWKLITNGVIVIGVTELVFEENYSLAFGNIFANGTAVIANAVSAPVTFAAGDNIAITGNNTTKTVTIGVTGISLNSISNGTSNVTVVSSGGNVTVGVAGSEVAEFSTVGQDLTGALTVSGNTNIGSGLFFVNTSSNRIGVGTATPDYPFEIETTGTNSLLVLTRTDGAACFIEGQASRSAFGSVGATPLALAYNSLAVVTIGAGGAITVNPDGGNPYTLPIADGNANELLSTDGAGNVDFTATPSVTTLTATGNITGGNISTVGELKTTGTFLIGTQEFFAQGSDGFSVNENFNAGNATVTAYHYTSGAGRNAIVFDTAVTGQFTNGFGATGNAAQNKFVSFAEFGNTTWEWRKSVGISAPNLNGGTLLANINPDGNLYTLGTITATGNISGNYILGNGSQLTGLPATYGNANVADFLANGFGSNTITTTGNITADYFLGNGAGLTGVNVFSNVAISGGNAIVASSISDTLTLVAGTGIALIGNSASNTITIAATGSGDSIFSTGGTMGLVTEAPTDTEDLGLVTEAVTESYDLETLGIDGIVTNVNIVDGSISGNKLAPDTDITTTGNITGGNLLTPNQVIATGNITGGNVTAIGNITANYFIGDGSQLTNVTASASVDFANVASDIIPAVDITYGLGNATNQWASVFGQDFAVTGNITGNLIPSGNITYNIGSDTLRWNELYLAGNSIYLGNVVITNTSGNTIGFFGPNGTTPAELIAQGNLANTVISSLGVGTAASGNVGEIRATDNITAYFSDRRLKEITGTIPDAIDKVMSLSGIQFVNNDRAAEFGYISRHPQVGVIAQEVQRVLPEAVVPAPFDIATDAAGREISRTGENYLTVHYDKIIPLLIEAIKQQQLIIRELQRRMD